MVLIFYPSFGNDGSPRLYKDTRCEHLDGEFHSDMFRKAIRIDRGSYQIQTGID